MVVCPTVTKVMSGVPGAISSICKRTADRNIKRFNDIQIGG
jgi:hypothetical protein